jgi:hypothetical protein
MGFRVSSAQTPIPDAYGVEFAAAFLHLAPLQSLPDLSRLGACPGATCGFSRDMHGTLYLVL